MRAEQGEACAGEGLTTEGAGRGRAVLARLWDVAEIVRRCRPLLSLQARAASADTAAGCGSIQMVFLLFIEDTGPPLLSRSRSQDAQAGEAADACSNQQTPTCIVLSCPFRIVVSIPPVSPCAHEGARTTPSLPSSYICIRFVALWPAVHSPALHRLLWWRPL